MMFVGMKPSVFDSCLPLRNPHVTIFFLIRLKFSIIDVDVVFVSVMFLTLDHHRSHVGVVTIMVSRGAYWPI